ncbi:hypothetical protein ACTIVE_2292 [Actinomadura verrucosospora]|uniref:Uncharacterized protein n=1 Tax=Actinomadura verrucosospora TaxID=46165 RepID=A0A7D3VTS9_ACTVE|nr:hypothetical protein ACTIVE_2292 [Actinomadura verrucosospora]
MGVWGEGTPSMLAAALTASG